MKILRTVSLETKFTRFYKKRVYFDASILAGAKKASKNFVTPYADNKKPCNITN